LFSSLFVPINSKVLTVPVERCSRFAGSEDCNWESLELIKGRCLGFVDSEEVTLA